MENIKIALKRRYPEIEERISDLMFGRNISSFRSFDDLLTEVSWDVASDIALETTNFRYGTDQYVTFRNIVRNFIKNNFYEYLKSYWDR
jgi:hypothetical protein